MTSVVEWQAWYKGPVSAAGPARERWRRCGQARKTIAGAGWRTRTAACTFGRRRAEVLSRPCPDDHRRRALLELTPLPLGGAGRHQRVLRADARQRREPRAARGHP